MAKIEINKILDKTIPPYNNWLPDAFDYYEGLVNGKFLFVIRHRKFKNQYTVNFENELNICDIHNGSNGAWFNTLEEAIEKITEFVNNLEKIFLTRQEKIKNINNSI